ncbi:uncharacterized protein TNCV_842961 [Trichonephila clavipes]|nr:uncharacterized protein TNCV_842961 [Trichonephila clavipes]
MALLMPQSGAAVYCKSKNLNSETLVQLITSKSRVEPIKSLTILRLELCAAVLLAKLVKRVVAALQLESAELYRWSDSMIVLTWLRKEPMDLKTFVQNRVAKIQELYNQLWRHVPSDQNPADLVSRGVDPDKLLQQNLWFNGPTFLSGDDYPNRTINCREKLDEYNSELKNCVNEKIENYQSVLNIHVNDFLKDLLNLSNNYITILRVLSFIFRFVENLKDINRVAGPLTTKEFEKAETFLCYMKGNTRNRWRDGPVCPAEEKELRRLGPDSSGVFCANRTREVKRDFGPANKKERGACCEHTPVVLF